ncbi:peptide-methionine (S)-S-oxide reductase MsrA [Paracoccus stylophorae]|uniref:Peptide methionine sulfoxide reductase MsrA n=1 Tax=Paracoccus stylophorae TaxID=659350 RepID=A0ABY7SWG9_9RHOB|nr:peptide-methionine (S)-S-oxide reductase MsrA [Paracoccus stylophorae]WCR11375.1 peptide-methionine (S)-S-oxide reductase MsrA [Paracoccus stylophorae]
MTTHAIFNRPLDAQAPQGFDQAIFGMGCYWGPERLFWQQHGVWLTEVGFAGGTARNPTYDQVCKGDTGHAEVVRIVYDSSQISYEHLLKLFWEHHDPTQGDRQGNDVGSQYRSLIMVFNDSQRAAAEASKVDYGNRLALEGFGKITTQIVDEGPFWPAPAEHQQYLEKNPGGYCALEGTGVEASLPNPDPI